MASIRQPLSRALSRSRSTQFVCTSCRSQLRSLQCTVQQRGYASKQDLPFTERIRRKIWGTDNPPGLADPYGGPSILEKRRMRREAAQRQAAGIEEDNTERFSPNAGDSHEIQQSARSEATEYTEARTWDGLQHIGHLNDWRDLPPEPKDQYYSWFNATSQIASDRRELLSCLHQAIVECLACKEAQVDPASTLLFDPSEIDSQVYADARVEPANGALQLHFASEEQRESLLDLLRAVHEAVATPDVQTGSNQPDLLPEEEVIEKETLEQHEVAEYEVEDEIDEAVQFGSPVQQLGVSHYEVLDETFLAAKLDLQDPLSFMMLKRFSQLSGHRIPDPLLNATLAGNKPLSYLLDALHEDVKPKPKNLAQVLMQKQNLMGQSNVWVMPRRETPVDKQKEVGRWKVIERELQERGLPVLGKLQS